MGGIGSGVGTLMLRAGIEVYEGSCQADVLDKILSGMQRPDMGRQAFTD